MFRTSPALLVAAIVSSFGCEFPAQRAVEPAPAPHGESPTVSGDNYEQTPIGQDSWTVGSEEPLVMDDADLSIDSDSDAALQAW